MSNIATSIVATILSLGINRQDIHQPLTDSIVPFTVYLSIAQSFTAHANNLNSVSICLRNPGKVVIPLDFSLHEATVTATPVRTIDFSSSNIDGDDCTRFQFAPVGDSADKNYVAAVTRRGDDVPTGEVYIEAYHGGDDVVGNIYGDGNETVGDLHFKTTYREQMVTTIKDALVQFFHRAKRDAVFFVLYILLISVVVIRFIRGRKSS